MWETCRLSCGTMPRELPCTGLVFFFWWEGGGHLQGCRVAVFFELERSRGRTDPGVHSMLQEGVYVVVSVVHRGFF